MLNSLCIANSTGGDVPFNTSQPPPTLLVQAETVFFKCGYSVFSMPLIHNEKNCSRQKASETLQVQFNFLGEHAPPDPSRWLKYCNWLLPLKLS